MREGTEQKVEEPVQACLGLMNFVQNWDEWRDSLSETVRAAREIDPSEQHTVEVVEDMIDFLSERVCPGSPEERLIRAMWDRSEEDERRTMARVLLRMLD